MNINKIVRSDPNNMANNMDDLPRIVASTPIGETVDVGIFRKSQDRTVKVKVGGLSD